MKTKISLLFCIAAVFSLVSCSRTDDKPSSKRPQPPKPVYNIEETFLDKVYSAETEDSVVTIHTKLGDIQLVLFNATPGHKSNFLKHVNSGFYNGTTFHRVIKDFMIQGGDPNSKDEDPTNDGMGGPGYQIDNEISTGFLHQFGAVAAARNNNPEKMSSGSQFYIVENPAGTEMLDRQYTVYGQAISGFDVIHKIVSVEKDNRDRPLENVEMTVDVKVVSVEKIKNTFKSSVQSLK